MAAIFKIKNHDISKTKNFDEILHDNTYISSDYWLLKNQI